MLIFVLIKDISKYHKVCFPCIYYVSLYVSTLSPSHWILITEKIWSKICHLEKRNMIFRGKIDNNRCEVRLYGPSWWMDMKMINQAYDSTAMI